MWPKPLFLTCPTSGLEPEISGTSRPSAIDYGIPVFEASGCGLDVEKNQIGTKTWTSRCR